MKENIEKYLINVLEGTGDVTIAELKDNIDKSEIETLKKLNDIYWAEY